MGNGFISTALRTWGMAALAGALTWGSVRVQAQEAVGDHPLMDAAARLELRLGGRSMTAASAERRLSAPVRAALNTWAETIAAWGLEVVVPEQADCVLLGRCDRKLMEALADQVDQAWDLIEPVRVSDDPWDDAVVGLLFDQQGAASEAWGGVLDALVAHGDLVEDGARFLRLDPGSLTLRQAPAFLQPAWDVAGNAAAGDDEFRLGNEVVHKLVQCVMTERFGALPDNLRWGLGYVAEQRVFRSIYQFEGSGFVAAADHFEWPKRTAATLKEASRAKDFSLAELALSGAAGRAETPQMATWAALDQLLHQDPEGLVAMLSALAELHAQASPFRGGAGYAGEAKATQDVFVRHFDAIAPKDLLKHLKRVK